MRARKGAVVGAAGVADQQFLASSANLGSAIAVTLLLWASAFPAIRRGLDGYTPYHLALFRFAIAAIVLGALAPWMKLRRPAREDLPRLVAAGLFGIAIYHCGLNYGQQTVTAGAASFIINTVPIFTSLIAWLVLRERITPMHWAGVALSFCGIALITWGEGRHLSRGHGAWFILLAAISQSLCIVLQKPLFKNYTVFEVACYTLWSGTIFLGIFSPGLIAEIQRAKASCTLAVVYLGIFPAALAHLCWTFVLGQIPAARATTFFYAIPPLSLAISWIWLRESPGLLTLLGCSWALGGVLIVNRARRGPSEK